MLQRVFIACQMIVVLMATLLTSAASLDAAEGEFPADYASCTKPSLSRQDIVEIIATARDTDASLPRPVSDLTYEVRRRRCHYVYSEYTHTLEKYSNIEYVVLTQDVTLDASGRIVDWWEPRVGNHHTCPEEAFTAAQTSEFVAASREQFSDLPPYREGTEVSLRRVWCFYLHTERLYTGEYGEDGKEIFVDYYFYLDHFGALEDFSRVKYVDVKAYFQGPD